MHFNFQKLKGRKSNSTQFFSHVPTTKAINLKNEGKMRKLNESATCKICDLFYTKICKKSKCFVSQKRRDI